MVGGIDDIHKCNSILVVWVVISSFDRYPKHFLDSSFQLYTPCSPTATPGFIYNYSDADIHAGIHMHTHASTIFSPC